jgi:hypothetical protein
VSEGLVDPADVIRGRPQAFQVGCLAVACPELGHCASMSGVARVNDRTDQFVSLDATAVLGGAVTAPPHAHRSRAVAPRRNDRLELDDVLPAVTEVIVVKQRVTRMHQHLIEPDVLFGDTGVVFFHWKGQR